MVSLRKAPTRVLGPYNLGTTGFEVEVIDANPRCLARFSKFLPPASRAPQLGVDPLGYVERVVSLLKESRFDVLFPAYQAYRFARFLDRLFDLMHLALPPFDAFQRRQSKVDFAGVLEGLGLPSPPTVVARTLSEDDQTKRWHATLRGKTCRFETVPDRARRNNGLPDPNGRRLLEFGSTDAGAGDRGKTTNNPSETSRALDQAPRTGMCELRRSAGPFLNRDARG
jgi:hypothetical protein